MNSGLKRIVFTFLFSWLMLSAAQAATYYVRQGCTNNITTYNPGANTCTGGSDRVYSSINNALNGKLLVAGSTLDIRGGTYSESIDTTNGNVPPGGTDWGANAVTIQGYPGETVIITGSGGHCIWLATPSAGNQYAYFIFKHIICEGVNITVGTDANNGGTVGNMKFDDVTVQHITGVPVGNSAGFGFGYKTGENNWVINSKCDGIATGLSGLNQYHCFYVSGANNLIENTEIVNVPNGFGIHQYTGADPTANNNIYRNLRIHRIGLGNSSTGLDAMLLADGDNTRFYNNLVYDSQQGIGDFRAPTNPIIANNTFYNFGYAGAGCSSPCNVITLSSSVNARVQNNIIWNTTNIDNYIVTTSGTTVDHNICPSGCSSSSDPQFTNSGAGDFTLASNSPAIDAGTANIAPGFVIPACSGGIVTNCYNGKAPDIGAFETGVPSVGGTPPTLRPNPPVGITIGMVISATAENDDGTRRTANVGDYVGLYVPGASASTFIDWFYMNGTKTAPSAAINDALILFTAPSAIGAYEFRFYQNNSTSETDRLATAAFTVGAKGLVFKYNGSAITKMAGTSQTVKVGVP